MTKMTAIIPVRAGSRRLKNKNILPFGDSNLLVWKIRQLKTVESIDNIIVSSDSDIMLQMALDEHVNIHKRELIFADEKTMTFGDVVINICENIESENILWATCTSPFATPSLYADAIEQFYKRVPQEYDSLQSFEELHRYLWDNNGPINYKLGREHVSSQNVDVVFCNNCAISISSRENMLKWHDTHGPNPYKFIMSKLNSIDIDDEFDYISAKSLIGYIK